MQLNQCNLICFSNKKLIYYFTTIAGVCQSNVRKIRTRSVTLQLIRALIIIGFMVNVDNMFGTVI